MKFDVLTLFPEMFEIFNYSIIRRAADNGLVDLKYHNIRDFSTNKHKKVDDYPYGGGAGMVMQAEPVYNAVDYIVDMYGYKPYTILMSPRGEKFTEESAVELSKIDHCLIICGHYEGLDERIMPLVDREVSLGDFVLTGGEIASMAVIDAVCRLVPGVLSTSESFVEESFYSSMLEYPQYTRPDVFMDMKVPDVLLSGHHRKISEWRRYESLKLTYERRPDLLLKAELSKKDKEMLKKIADEKNK